MTNRVAVLMDFDGVFRFYGSRNQRRKHADLPGHLRRATVLSENGRWYEWNWSAELVKKTNDLRAEYGFNWHWLTSWTGETGLLERTLGLTAGDSDMSWDAFPDEVKVWGRRATNEEYNAYRAERKLEKVLEFVAANPDTPFMWADDEAAPLWTEELSHSVSVPHLVLAPDSDLALSLTHLDSMRNFLESVNG